MANVEKATSEHTAINTTINGNNEYGSHYARAASSVAICGSSRYATRVVPRCQPKVAVQELRKYNNVSTNGEAAVSRRWSVIYCSGVGNSIRVIVDMLVMSYGHSGYIQQVKKTGLHRKNE